ncbi:MAG: hypothetical protein JXA71_07915 [Chitinispirillaceae bacterium]|nr:hypothetical protein [Chitinispirillaceae bacterium]
MKRKTLIASALVCVFVVFPASAETVVLDAVAGSGSSLLGWVAGGATVGDDASAPGGTATTYTGKVPNRRFYVPMADTAMSESDIIYSVQVRVRAKADIPMEGTYDGIRIAIYSGTTEVRTRPIYELDTVYSYYSAIFAKNPANGLSWTWSDINALQAGVLTAKTRQLTYATYSVDHIQAVVTYGNGNKPPVASSVSISGTLRVGDTLKGSYSYSDDDGDPEGGSLFQWYRAESQNPNDTLKAAISSGVEKNYLLRMLEEGKYVSFEVTPMASQGVLMGIPVESDMLGPVLAKEGSAPTATGVRIIGTALTGETLVGTYTYSDDDGDREGATTFRWLRDGLPINGANDTTYKTTGNDAGKTITFEVTPVALTGLPKTGAPVVSSGLTIGGNTGVVGKPASLWSSTVASRMIVDIKGRVVGASYSTDLSRGAYVEMVKTSSGVRCRKVAVIK